jgi:hypothetical protein
VVLLILEEQMMVKFVWLKVNIPSPAVGMVMNAPIM